MVQAGFRLGLGGGDQFHVEEFADRPGLLAERHGERSLAELQRVGGLLSRLRRRQDENRNALSRLVDQEQPLAVEDVRLALHQNPLADDAELEVDAKLVRLEVDEAAGLLHLVAEDVFLLIDHLRREGIELIAGGFLVGEDFIDLDLFRRDRLRRGSAGRRRRIVRHDDSPRTEHRRYGDPHPCFHHSTPSTVSTTASTGTAVGIRRDRLPAA